MRIIERKINELRALCIKHKVKDLFVFGSVLNENFNTKSDLDFLVEFEGVDLYDYADNFFDFKSELENLFQRKVDLLESKALKNPYLIRELEATKQPVYGLAS